MIFSLINLRKDISYKEISSICRQGIYGGHKLVWDIFSDSPDRQRDFLYRQGTTGLSPRFYVVSRRSPMNSKGFWEVSFKEYNPKIYAGERFAFMLRANPVKTKKDSKGRQHRHDVIMETKKELGFSRKNHFTPDVIQEAGGKWLLERCGKLGFSVAVGALRIDGYRQHKFYKSKNAEPVSFSTIDINGILTVNEPDVFVEKSLFGGIGPAKGFGCGLMLIRRI